MNTLFQPNAAPSQRRPGLSFADMIAAAQMMNAATLDTRAERNPTIRVINGVYCRRLQDHEQRIQGDMWPDGEPTFRFGLEAGHSIYSRLKGIFRPVPLPPAGYRILDLNEKLSNPIQYLKIRTNGDVEAWKPWPILADDPRFLTQTVREHLAEFLKLGRNLEDVLFAVPVSAAADESIESLKAQVERMQKQASGNCVCVTPDGWSRPLTVPMLSPVIVVGGGDILGGEITGPRALPAFKAQGKRVFQRTLGTDGFGRRIYREL